MLAHAHADYKSGAINQALPRTRRLTLPRLFPLSTCKLMVARECDTNTLLAFSCPGSCLPRFNLVGGADGIRTRERKWVTCQGWPTFAAVLTVRCLKPLGYSPVLFRHRWLGGDKKSPGQRYRNRFFRLPENILLQTPPAIFQAFDETVLLHPQ